MNMEKAHLDQKVNTSKSTIMYEEAKDWISTLEFHNDSLIGLKNIIDRYLDEMVLHENLDEIRECVMRLQEVRYTCRSLLKKVKSHQSLLIKQIDKKQEINLVLENSHQALNARLRVLKTKFHEIKNEVFFITEYAMEIDKEEKLTVELEKIKASRYN